MDWALGLDCGYFSQVQSLILRIWNDSLCMRLGKQNLLVFWTLSSDVFPDSRFEIAKLILGSNESDDLTLAALLHVACIWLQKPEVWRCQA